MSQQRRGLGKGLGALIPAGSEVGEAAVPRTLSSVSDAGRGEQDQAAGPAGAWFDEIPLTSVTPNPRQPRQALDEDSLAELASSIREVGLLQPVVVRKLGPNRYELVMGERRWRAAQEAGLQRLPAIVRDTGDDAMLRDALMENLHREQLNPLEEAAAYEQLLSDFGVTHEELAGRIGRSRPHITNTLRLLNLSPAVQRRVAAGVLSAGHARAILAVEDPEAQDRLAHRIVAEGLSVRAVEELITLGDAQARPQRPRSQRKEAPPELRDLAGRLSDRFETRVKVDMGRRKGKIVVEFASMEDLDRIIEVMTPDGATGRDAGAS